MKKLFGLVALVGMGAFLAGCGGEEKPAAPSKPPAGMGGPGGVSTGPKGEAKEEGGKGEVKKEEEGEKEGAAATTEETKEDEGTKEKKDGE